MTIDLLADASNETPQGSLEELMTMVQQMEAARALVQGLEQELKDAKQQLRDLEEFKLPERMGELSLPEFVHDGVRVKIQDQVRASITKANEAAAFQWLREHGHGDIIKNEVAVQFGQGDDSLAQDALDLLQKHAFAPTQKQSVHSSTLSAFCREQLKKGASFPEDLFSLFVGKKAKATKL